MKNIIRKYIKKMDKGLFLLDAPTGYGKTTAVVEYINDFLVNSYDDAKRIFFITHLKKNLPIAKMKALLGEDNFNRYCLYLQPYFENVIENWKIANITDEDILKSEQYGRLNTAISNIYDLRKNESKENKKYIKNIESHIEKELEPKFRELIKGLHFYKKMSSEKKSYIQRNKWIQILYPSTIIERYKVIFTSTNKFCFPLDVFHKLPFHIYNDPILDDSIVFIDEFDSNKDTLLSSIIEEGLKLKIDVIKLFVHIYYALNNLSIPKEILKTSKDIKEKIDLKKYYSTEEIINQNKERFNSLYEKYKFNYLIKTRDIKEDKAFLFSDGNYVTITKDNSKKQFFSEIEQEKANQRIVFSGYGRNSKYDKVQDIIEEVVKAIEFFSVGVLWVSKNYQSYKNESKSKESNYYTIEEAIRSTLSIFNISDEFIDYLFELITAEKLERIIFDEKTDENTNNFIRNGLSFLEVEDSDYHDMQSIFHMFRFNLTPEELLLKICKKAKVIGVSATATLDTVIGNFDLHYIKKKLKNNYFTINPEDYNSLKEDFENTQNVYEQKHIDINISVVDDLPTLDYASICEKLIISIFFGDKKNKYLKYLKELEYDNIYYYLIVLKIAYSYKIFAENSNMKSFICFLNGLPKQTNSQKRFADLVQIEILEVLNDVSTNEIQTFFIRSNNFDENMSIVYEELNANKKCFVITTYQTLGTGKNIQYDIPDGIDEHIIIQDNERKQKDFDGIYLLTPTNLIQNLNVKQSKDKYKELSRFLFQQEYLYTNKYNYYYVMLNNIRNAFKRLFFGEIFAPINIKNGDLFKNNARVIIQAVGRICRCKNKNRAITIISDAEIIHRLHDIEDVLSKRLLNKEFEQLLKTNVRTIQLPLNLLSEKNNSIKMY